MKNLNYYLKIIILSIVITGLLSVQVSAITADALFRPVQGPAPLNVMFNDASAGKPIEWHWDFGDGFTGDGPVIMHTYMTPGTYTVTLMVLDAGGLSDTIKFTGAITVSPGRFMPVMPMNMPSFSADFTGGPQSGPGPLSVSFSDLSKGDPDSWVWDFGDGATSTEKNPVHIYSAPGSYTVTLKISRDSASGMKERKNYITVTQKTGGYENQAVSSDSAIPPGSEGLMQSIMAPEDEASEFAFSIEHETVETGYCLSGLNLTAEVATISLGEDFIINVNGRPLEKVYIWISSEDTIKDGNLPVIMDDGMVFDNQEGPYTIGSFIPDAKTGLMISDLVISDESDHRTGLYGLLALDKDGKYLFSIQAALAEPGNYTINAVSGEQDKTGDCINKLQVTILP